MEIEEQIKKELETVKTLTGIEDESRIQKNKMGWTSRVYIIDSGKIVFKFPKNEESKKEYSFEINNLELIKNSSFDIKIPIIHWIAPNNDYIGFYGVLGESLTEDLLNTLNVAQKTKLGKLIGSFLKKLHSIKPIKKHIVMTVKDEIEEYQEKYKMSLPILKLNFNIKELKKIEHLFMIEMPNIMTSLGEDLVFCHGDLGYNNILLSGNNLGVIDFGDSGLYDKSKDFIGIEDKIIQEHAIISYGDDATLRKKIIIREKVLPILDIPFYVGNKDQKGIHNCVNKIRKNLKL